MTLRPAPAFSLIVSIFMLYYLTGRLCPFHHGDGLSRCLRATYDGPIRQNLVVVMLHCAWVAPSAGLLKKVDNPSCKRSTRRRVQHTRCQCRDGVGAAEVEMEAYGDEDKRVEASHGGTNLWGTRSGKSAWWSSTRRANWVWWVVGGYAVTLLSPRCGHRQHTLPA